MTLIPELREELQSIAAGRVTRRRRIGAAFPMLGPGPSESCCRPS